MWTCVCACGLACFFRDIAHDAAAPAVRSACAVFEAHTILVEEIQRVSRRQANAAKVRSAVHNFLMSYHEVFGPDSMSQKFHYLHHLSGYVSRWGHVALPSCWTLERKHKSSKRFANALQVGAAASSKWDSSVLRSVTERHLWQLSDGNAFKTEFLVNPSKVSKAMASELTKQFGAAEFLTSPAARCRYHVVKYGDLVLLGNEREDIVADVLKHVCFTREGHYYGMSLVQPYLLHDRQHARCSMHVRSGPEDAIWVHTSSIVCSLTWAAREGGAPIHVLRPVWAEPRWA